MSAAVSPSPRHERVNAHPYAIKTTSTALLTRSNSTGPNSRTMVHSYQPPSPSPGSPSHALKGYHRPSKSTSSMGPPDSRPIPLPMPPSPSTPARFANGFPSADLDAHSLSETDAFPRMRANSLPSLPSPTTLASLPDNPKLWTPSHLAAYLSSTLRFKSADAAVPSRLADDIAQLVYDQKLSGRVFLRLAPADLDSMGVNALWREALLDAARDLRTRVLQGRIWGFGHDENGSPGERRRMPSTVDESGEEDNLSPTRSRVRAMAASFERTASESSDELHVLPVTPRKHRRRLDQGTFSESSASEEDITTQHESNAPLVAAELSHEPEATLVNDSEEPTMEQLLAEEPPAAHPWEVAELTGAATARRIDTGVTAKSAHNSSKARASLTKRALRDVFAADTEKIQATLDAHEDTLAAHAEVQSAHAVQLTAHAALISAQADMIAALTQRIVALEARVDLLEAERARAAEAQALEKELAAVSAEVMAAATAQEEDVKLIPALRELPGYVALVSVGVCAVVMGSIIRRLSGRRP